MPKPFSTYPSSSSQRFKKRLGMVWLIMGWTLAGIGQISPGPLSDAHAEFEGIRNCTLCHELGKEVSDVKCLDCHKEIQALLTGGRGYHADASVRDQACFECHSEHHGRKFDQTRFDQDAFNHALTGYELEGQHAVIDCRECHKPDYIADADIRELEGTFLGMEQECLSCHDDYHQETLSPDCAACHNFEGFEPAPRFDHNETDYALQGAHAEVECIECHKVTTRNGQEFQEFADIPFADCAACHDDVHNEQLPGACAQCHSVESWDRFQGQRGFNHNRTDFALAGAHAEVSCFECHQPRSNPLTVFQDQNGVAENNCVACHADHHEGKYGTDCAQCHTVESFLALKDMSFFDHDVTDYPLAGMHVEVDCRACHESRFSDPIDFSACQNCHEDYHEGEFVATTGSSPDCATCHSLEQGFEYSLYTLEQHQESQYPLEGAHIATPCFACHLDEANDHWNFRNIGDACVDCHTDIHEGYIASTFYPEQNCAACHTSDLWTQVNFNHDATDWPLTGQHTTTACRACHFEAQADGSYTQLFAELGNDCISCHENVHDDEFAIDGVTDCERCHVTSSWLPEKFDHSQTAFPLEGQHAEVDCRACHALEQPDGTLELVYKLTRFECADCHQ